MTEVAQKISYWAKEIKTYTAEQVISTAFKLLSRASDNNLITLTKFLENIATSPTKKATIKTIREAFESKHPAIQLAKRLLKELHPNCQKGIISYVVNAIQADSTTRHHYQQKYGSAPPITILISPTMRCNLNCQGCYAGQYQKAMQMEPQLFDRLLKECEEMGTHLITLLGGEPFTYRYLFDVIAQHPKLTFQIFTNGTLLTERTIAKIIELGNIAPVISLEGFSLKTNRRRGSGIFERVNKAMDDLHQAGALFLYSVTVTRENCEEVLSDEFIDFMITKGAALGWYFNYMPVGRGANLNLMPTPKQRNFVREKVTAIRQKKPILLIDFWGDGPLVDGCLAGGKLYLHINANGDVEPCIFAHYATDNIKEKTIAEALNSDFFKAIRRYQPFGHVPIRPCPLIDYPGVMSKLVKKYNARCTHEGAELLINDFVPELKKYARHVATIYRHVWPNEYQWALKNEQNSFKS